MLLFVVDKSYLAQDKLLLLGLPADRDFGLVFVDIGECRFYSLGLSLFDRSGKLA